MKLATWNVNSVRARKERLLRWLESQQPDALCLQELKVQDQDFPFAELEQVGYHATVFGQKTYNGVAILSRQEPEDVQKGFADGAEEDPAARLIAARIRGVLILSAYFPNGQDRGSDKYAYKLSWMKRLRALLDRRYAADEPLALCGDFNVAPEARDVHDPAAWEESVLFHPEVRAALEQIRGWGLTDTFRLHHEEAGLHSWWDYRRLAFPKNRGLRIDHIFASPSLARCCVDCAIDRQERKGKQPSDHAPVVAVFEL